MSKGAQVSRPAPQAEPWRAEVRTAITLVPKEAMLQPWQCAYCRKEHITEPQCPGCGSTKRLKPEPELLKPPLLHSHPRPVPEYRQRFWWGQAKPNGLDEWLWIVGYVLLVWVVL